MIYQTYGAITISPVVLKSMEPSTLSLAGIGDIRCVPMSNLDIWSGAVILCTWEREPVNGNPKAMYLIDTEGDDYQFYGSTDVLMYEGVVYDLTVPYGCVLNVAEQVLMIISNQDDAAQWWNEYIELSILMNLQGSDLTKYALSLAQKYTWPVDVLSQIKNIKIKSVLSPIHKAKRLHYLVAEHEHQSAQHID